MLSHVALWKEAADKQQTLLVFEDDAVFCNDFSAKATAFISKVPEDWQMLYFGGSHIMPPEHVRFGVCRCLGVKKTHAYAVRGDILRSVPPILDHDSRHIDVVLSRFHHQFLVYAPNRWLCGQAAGVSDVLSGSHGEPERWFGGAA